MRDRSQDMVMNSPKTGLVDKFIREVGYSSLPFCLLGQENRVAFLTPLPEVGCSLLSDILHLHGPDTDTGVGNSLGEQASEGSPAIS